MEKKTPLYDLHLSAGGKMVPFAGYLMPVQYGTGIMAEHRAVRTQAGLFDVSHMGELLVEGPDAMKLLQRLLTNDFSTIAVGTCRYSPMCNHEGGVVDDLLVYALGEQRFWLVVNAANEAKDEAWIRKHLEGNIHLENQSAQTGQLALQGPLSKEILEEITQGALPEKYYTFKANLSVAGVPCLVSKTGYTGEAGYEIYGPAHQLPHLWEALLNAGLEKGLIPCGLGARDTLRLEAGMPLYGHEMDEHISPLEAGLGSFVKWDKGDFIGRLALESKPVVYERVGLQIQDRGIAREGAPVKSLDGELLGEVTSGTQAPHLGVAVAMARLIKDRVEVGEVLEVEVRGRLLKAQVVELPFYRRS